MKPIPFLFYSDSPEQPTGLSRIGRDLATFLSRSPLVRVGYLGYQGMGSRQLPFPQYNFQRPAGQWGEDVLEKVWYDFAGREAGIIFTIWDATRLTWYARPDLLDSNYASLKRFLERRHFQRWGYFPIDATGPHDRLTGIAGSALLGFDRLLAYTPWAKGLIERTIGHEEAQARDLQWLPHGLNLSTFQPRDKSKGREMLDASLTDDDYLIGCVMTNQARKDWGLFFTTAAVLRSKIKRLRLWCHVHTPLHLWSLPALMRDYGLEDITIVTTEASDEQMAHYYSACDLTLLPSMGEGFGYPIFESLACGVPCVHGDYAGGADLMRTCGLEKWLVPPAAWRLETQFNCLRPVYRPEDWVEKVIEAGPTIVEPPEFWRAKVEHLGWDKLWSGVWLRWFEKGVESWWT